eukprot:TRINITY_DN5789_c1_g1_i2.p1 TRINITY_DN5789_c1_g1~~TRINITY_DN5789_c1_g1_i2.p1  ORF type:complete len:418 (+),score=51.00 TRINITY_DN5789_c1_g1_i2:56-1309(+)
MMESYQFRSAIFVAILCFSNKVILAASKEASSWRSPGPVKTKDQEWRRLPGECNIDVLSESEWRERFLSDYWFRRPVILRGYDTPEIAGFRKRFERDAMISEFGDVDVMAGTFHQLSEDGGGGTAMKLRDYLKNMEGKGGNDLYAFDRGTFFNRTGLNKGWKTLPGMDSSGTYEFREGQEEQSLTLALGSNGQGLPFHWHCDSYSIALHGRKRWAIYAPNQMTPTGYLSTESFVTWLQKRRRNAHGKKFVPPTFECIQEPGDVLYVPEGFFHATASIGDSVGITHIAELTAWYGANKSAYAYVTKATSVLNPKKTLKLLNKAAKKDTTNALVHYFKSWVYRHQKDWENAAKHTKAALERNPLHLPSHHDLVFVLGNQGKYEESNMHMRLATDLGIAFTDDEVEALRNVKERPSSFEL